MRVSLDWLYISPVAETVLCQPKRTPRKVFFEMGSTPMVDLAMLQILGLDLCLHNPIRCCHLVFSSKGAGGCSSPPRLPPLCEIVTQFKKGCCMGSSLRRHWMNWICEPWHGFEHYRMGTYLAPLGIHKSLERKVDIAFLGVHIAKVHCATDGNCPNPCKACRDISTMECFVLWSDRS